MDAPFRTLADIEALELLPYEEAIPARTTYGLIARAAALHDERTALVYLPDGDLDTPPRRVSYREMLAQVNRAANLFHAMGLGADDSVAILAPNIPESQHPLPVLQIRTGGKLPLTAVVFQDALTAQNAQLEFDPQLTPDRIAACFHTGGTTGAPKLALHTHGNEAHTSWFAHRFYGFDEHTVEVNGFPLFHVAGAFVYGLALLAVGGTQVLPTLTGMRNARFARNYWKFCEREGVTALACVPTILASLANLPADADISRIRVAYTGGSPLPPELAARFEREPGIPVRNILGMTECAGLVSIEPFAASRIAGSAGLRLPFTEVRAVPWREGAARLDERCAAGETGVIVLRGPHVSPGYSDPARNAGMFENGWLVSGDLGHIDPNGYIHVTGRAKDVIIRGSHNIDPSLVEEAFLAHPAVALCAVVAEPDAYAGELPVAFVTLKPGATATAQEILLAVSPHVYERPATPKRVTVIDAMPVTAIGKIYKPALRLRAIEVKLGEVVSAVCGATPVSVVAKEQGSAMVAVASIGCAFDEVLDQRLREALAAIAVKTEFVFGCHARTRSGIQARHDGSRIEPGMTSLVVTIRRAPATHRRPASGRGPRTFRRRR